MSGILPGMFDLQRALAQPKQTQPQTPPDWTDRVMEQWQRFPPNPKGGGDFPNAVQAGQASHDLLQGANPKEVINPDRAAPKAGATRVDSQMPQLGALPGQPYLNPTIAPPVPPGAPRPLAPGEFVRNPDGGWSSEMTVTVTNPAINDGKPTVLPSLWIVGGKPTAVDEDTAAQFAVQSGLPFQGFATMDQAEAYATQRESAWQTIANPADAQRIPPLWAPASQPNE